MNSIYDEVLAGIHSVWQRRWLALSVAWGVCLLGWLVVAMVPNSYESRARIFVQLDDALAEQLDIGLGNRKRDIERVQQTLTSAVNLEKVIRSTRIGDEIKTPREMESVVLSLTKTVKVVSQQDNLFEITAISRDGSLSDSENSKLSQDIVQKLIDIFREENMGGGRGEMTDTLDFMEKQLADRQRDLDAAEQRRAAFEAQHPELVQGGAAGYQRLEAARASLRDIDADLSAAQSSLAAINGQLAGTPATLAGAAGPMGSARTALGQATAELAGMRARGLTDSHPDVIALKNQIASLRSQAQSEGNGAAQSVPNPAHTSLVSIQAERQANVQSLSSRRASVQGEIAQLTSIQTSNPAIAAEASRINRDADVLKQQYDKLLQDKEALRLRGSVETERNSVKFQVVDPPTTPRSPAAPNRPLLLFGVLIVGLGAGVAAAFAMGQLRSTFATTAKLERAIGLPVLGAISQVVNDAGRELRQRRQKMFLAGSAALGLVFAVLVAVEMIQVGMVA